jgi:hypothetical protein
MIKKLLAAAVFFIAACYGWHDVASAEGCRVRTPGSYALGAQIYDQMCDQNENRPFTMGTLLKVEVPATALRYISVGVTEDKHTVKDTPGTLFSITATNTNAAVRYIKCENDTTANTTVGSETPEWSFAIPSTLAGGPLNYAPPLGVVFTALTCWIVTGAADSDVAEVAANEIMVNYSFK